MKNSWQLVNVATAVAFGRAAGWAWHGMAPHGSRAKNCELCGKRRQREIEAGRGEAEAAAEFASFQSIKRQ